MASTIRFLRHYLRPRPGTIEVEQASYQRDGEVLAATLYRPAGRGGRLPGWVLLHGLTYQGRRHPSLDRFARAVAASGTVALVPDIPEWRRLQVTPAVSLPTIQAAALTLAARDDVEPGRTGVFGFSFGATQALAAAVDPRLEDQLRAVVAWGGYCDVHALFRFGITGEHELDGQLYQSAPDPYGRWIMAANYLTAIPAHSEDHALAHALQQLAFESGRRGTPAGSPVYDPLKAHLREALPQASRPLYDLIAPRSDAAPPDPEVAHAHARELADAALRTDPLLDPGPFLPRVRVRTLLAHGRDDRLVPFTEGLRLGRALNHDLCQGCTITSLFAHSGGTQSTLGAWGLSREAARFVGLLRRILDLI